MKNKRIALFVFSILILTIFSTGTIDLKKSAENFRLEISNNIITHEKFEKTSQLSFAAFADTHIGARYQFQYKMADHLDDIGDDLIDNTNLLDFSIHLGDIVNHNTGHVNGEVLPWYVNQYLNNLKAYLISHINLPFHCVLGNHDINDYEENSDDPHNLTKSLIDEISMNNPVYAMMRDDILFLVVPELGHITWTHPVEYEWIEYMTQLYPDFTTIILSHQAIEDTTEDYNHGKYRGKQDIDYWINLFNKNPQIKMWIHGHNHYPDWYVSNNSNGDTYPIEDFGHEMAFSAPFAQMDIYEVSDEDWIVIYNITSDKITSATWENNGKGGRWISEYNNSWNINTTYNPEKKGWYSFPMFLQDNETQLTDMKLLSPNISLQLIGTTPMELFYDEKMESPSGKYNDNILGFGNDKTGNVKWNAPGMHVYGPTAINFPEKYPSENKYLSHEDGRSGQPYHTFPMGTICASIPGQTYNFTIIAKSTSGKGKFNMSVNCTDWSTKSQYSVLPNSESQVFTHIFGPNYETIYGTYTVPDDNNAWFLQGSLDFLDSTDYDVSLFSVKRKRDSDTTENFHLCLSGTWYNSSGPLYENEMINLSIDPQFLSNSDGVINFTAFIDGNRYGMVNLIYHEPLLFSRNARFKVNNYSNGVFNLSLKKTITRNSPIEMIFWNLKIFQKYPLLTELFTRFLLSGFTGRVIDLIFAKKTSIFKMFPFSTDPIYKNIDINADDGSGVKKISNNGNIWLSCNCPKNKERFVEVILPNQ